MRPDGKHLCCGRTYLSSGMVEQAKTKAREMLDSLLPFAQKDIPIVGLEPSCLLTVRDEMLTMGLGPAAHSVARQAFLLEEFLAREAQAGRLDVLKNKLRPLDAAGAGARSLSPESVRGDDCPSSKCCA